MLACLLIMLLLSGLLNLLQLAFLLHGVGSLASVLVVLFLLAGSLTALIYCRFALACCFGKLGTYLSISATAFALEARSISLLLRI